MLILITLFGINLAPFFTPVQFIILALVSMLFIPCVATITVLFKEFGWKATGTVVASNFVLQWL